MVITLSNPSQADDLTILPTTQKSLCELYFLPQSSQYTWARWGKVTDEAICPRSDIWDPPPCSQIQVSQSLQQTTSPLQTHPPAAPNSALLFSTTHAFFSFCSHYTCLPLPFCYPSYMYTCLYSATAKKGVAGQAFSLGSSSGFCTHEMPLSSSKLCIKV